MTNILYISSSPRGDASYSNRVAARVLHDLLEAHPGGTLTIRDLARDPVPHIDADFASGIHLPDEKLTAAQRAALARSNLLVDELLKADIVLIAAPMINFAIPSTLKAWIDNIARAGRTFSYDNNGPKGLVTGRKVILVHAKGGVYSGRNETSDHQAPYLRHVLGFLGMTNVTVIDIEGTAMGPDAAEKAVEAGIRRARELVSGFRQPQRVRGLARLTA